MEEKIKLNNTKNKFKKRVFVKLINKLLFINLYIWKQNVNNIFKSKESI
jgi:hypothetical protein